MNGKRLPLAERGPLRVMFLTTSMPVGGAETLLVNLIRRLDRARFAPELCCLKERGPLGETLAREVPTHARLLSHKWDVRVLTRLTRLFQRRQVDAVITVGAGDKMFWGRLAARLAEVPVVAAALHSTGWPDGVGRLNRLLTPITDVFIGVAAAHGEHLVKNEGFPADKVRVIPNGVDTDRFAPLANRTSTREALGLCPADPVVGIVAALRPEKNHGLFLRAAKRVRDQLPQARFVIVGDGPERPALENLARELGLAGAVHFLGGRDDIPAVLAALDLFALTSDNEANPVSILEAMAMGKPVVATGVGSVAESVVEGQTGYLVEPGRVEPMAARWLELLDDPLKARAFGEAGRQRVVERGSLQAMVAGYEQLIETIYRRKFPGPRSRAEVEQPAGLS
jgi:glycosyltransferase involved in cell wall biosynthesis